MNLKSVGSLCAVAGVIIASFAGGAIARRSGFDAASWLLAAFGLGIVLLSQGPVLRLQHEICELRARLDDRHGA
jgi:hypothetical protein